jgi:lipoyl(octanoyl) transferase
MIFVHLGVLPFMEAWEKQERTRLQVASGKTEETVFLLEHPHIYTIGRTAEADRLIRRQGRDDQSLDLVRINRGGNITYHGPGQLVGYPILDLKRRRHNVHAYLRELEECLLKTASEFGICAFRREGLTGVWTEQGKLASIGIGVRQWVTMHGFALNVDPDLRYFQRIDPCGIPECPVTSLGSLLGRPVSMDEVIPIIESKMEEAFG